MRPAYSLSSQRPATRLTARHWLTGTAAVVAWAVGAPALAQAPAPPTVAATGTPAEEKPKKKPSADFPLSGSVRVNPSFGAGTFVEGPGARPATDLIMGYSLRYAIAPGLAASWSELLIKNVVSNGDSGASRPYDTTIGDIFLGLSWTPQTKNAKGENEALLLPGKIKFSTSLSGSLGVGRAARFAGRYGGLGLGVGLSRADLFNGVLTLSAGFSGSRNFLRTGGYAISDANAAGETNTMARPGGAEQLATGGVLIGSFPALVALRTSLSANVAIGKRWNIFATFLLINSFKSFDAPKDAFSAQLSKGGLGRSDSQWGIFGGSYNLNEAGTLVGSVSTFVVSAPFSADGKTWRMPFWDFRSAADNYATVGAELSYSF